MIAMTRPLLAALITMSGLFALSPTNVKAASVTVVLPQVQAPSDTTVEVPVRVRDAQQMGPFQMELRYDPQLIEFQSARESGSVSIGLFDSYLPEAGRVRIALTGDPSQPIAGAAELLVVVFKVRGGSGHTCSLTAENVRAWEQSTAALDLRVSVEPGTFTVAAPPALTPWLWGLLGGAGVLMAVFLTRRLARRSHSPPSD